MNFIEKRRIYEVDRKFYMVLTFQELQVWMQDAPYLIHYVHGEPCSEITRISPDREKIQ